MTIHDPNVDAMFRNRQQQPQGAIAVAAPISDVQLVALMAAHMVEKGAAPLEAADLALRTFAEVCAQLGKFPSYLENAKKVQEALKIQTTQ